MSIRLNLAGFSLPTMRGLFGSGDEEAIRRMRDSVSSDDPWRGSRQPEKVMEVVERAIRRGVPFRDLDEESSVHLEAAIALGHDGQEWLGTTCDYHATSLQSGILPRYARHARPEAQALLRGLAEGVPLFGRNPPPEVPYAIVGLEKLRAFRPALADLLVQVEYRAERNGEPQAAEFMASFCGWIDEIIDAGRDLFSIIS